MPMIAYDKHHDSAIVVISRGYWLLVVRRGRGGAMHHGVPAPVYTTRRKLAEKVGVVVALADAPPLRDGS